MNSVSASGTPLWPPSEIPGMPQIASDDSVACMSSAPVMKAEGVAQNGGSAEIPGDGNACAARPGEKPFLRVESCGASFFRTLQLWQSQPLFRCVNAGI